MHCPIADCGLRSADRRIAECGLGVGIAESLLIADWGLLVECGLLIRAMPDQPGVSEFLCVRRLSDFVFSR